MGTDVSKEVKGMREGFTLIFQTGYFGAKISSLQ